MNAGCNVCASSAETAKSYLPKQPFRSFAKNFDRSILPIRHLYGINSVVGNYCLNTCCFSFCRISRNRIIVSNNKTTNLYDMNHDCAIHEYVNLKNAAGKFLKTLCSAHEWKNFLFCCGWHSEAVKFTQLKCASTHAHTHTHTHTRTHARAHTHTHWPDVHVYEFFSRIIR